MDQFLKHGEGGARKFMNWKEKGKATVWLSTAAEIAYASWSHAFQFLDTVEDKDTKEEKTILCFTRFVSPDPEIVHTSQHFREKSTDRLKTPPRLDPFLLLREFLRFECEKMPLSQVIFKWTNPKDNKVIEWKRGELARLVERGKQNWNHSLDTKLEYMFVVVDNDKPEDGPQIVRGAKLLGDKMKKMIQDQMESDGDKGNPMKFPYAIQWKYDENAANMNDSYRAFRFNQAQITDKIREGIMATNFPKPDPDTMPRPGDKAKIRAAMESAAQVDLPWDRFFVKEWEDEDPTEFPPKEKPGRTPEVGTAPPAETKATASASDQPQRRKKAETKAAPPPPPEPEKIPCDDCGTMMLPTDPKCAKCGAEYDVEPAPTKVAAPAAKSTPAETKAAPASGGAQKAGSCFSCGSTNLADGKCQDCGLVLDDEIPF